VNMDTAVPDINPCATKAGNLGASHRRVTSINQPAQTLADAGGQFTARLVAISLDIAAETASGDVITVHAWHLPVTESLRSRHRKAVSMSDIEKFDPREWLVPPIMAPLFFGLIIAGAIIIQW
jgi:hypothetical protein